MGNKEERKKLPTKSKCIHNVMDDTSNFIQPNLKDNSRDIHQCIWNTQSMIQSNVHATDHQKL